MRKSIFYGIFVSLILPFIGISQTQFTDLNGVEQDGNSIFKTAAQAWNNAGFATQNSFDQNGYIQWIVPQTNAAIMIGLSEQNHPNPVYTTIQYALYTDHVGNVKVYESGQLKGTFGKYQAGDTFQIRRVLGNVIEYLRNGAVFYTSEQYTPIPLLGDGSFFHTGGRVDEIQIVDTEDSAFISSPRLINIVNIGQLGNIVYKSLSENNWGNCGFASLDQLDGDGYVSWTAATNNKAIMVGLSSDNPNSNFNTIDYALYTEHTKNIKIYENGVNRGVVSTYDIGDILKVSKTGETITYHKNDELIYTSTIPSNNPLKIDASFFHIGSYIENLKIVGSENNVANNPSPWHLDGGVVHVSSPNVGIGTQNTGDYKLAVEGKIRAREVRVDLDEWPDYVFLKDYKLPTLKELRTFIQSNGHLPNIPKAEETIKDGIELGEINKKLLEKIEELTLYILQQEERIERLETTLKTKKQ